MLKNRWLSSQCAHDPWLRNGRQWDNASADCGLWTAATEEYFVDRHRMSTKNVEREVQAYIQSRVQTWFYQKLTDCLNWLYRNYMSFMGFMDGIIYQFKLKKKKQA